ncbi:MAG: response regulator [Thermoanaerobaculales bacterium]
MTKSFVKRNLTTGDIAKLCGVNFRTVIRWIHRGHIKAFQLPGRGDNRVQMADFLTFLRENDMPIPEELQKTSHRVLIVQEDAKVAKSMERTLKRADFETMIAVDGFEAGALAITYSPAVVVLDPQMAGLGGLGALTTFRSRPELAKMKVLVVSDMSDKEMKDALAAGADDVLSRPYKGPELIKRVTALAG